MTGDEKRRPSGGTRTAHEPRDGDLTPDPTPLTRLDRLTWRDRVLARAGDRRTPQYGSPAWEQLPADDPRRVAAAVLAAEDWFLNRALQREREDMQAAHERYLSGGKPQNAEILPLSGGRDDGQR